MPNRPDPTATLTVTELTERLGVTRDRLDGFLKNKEVQIAVGALDLPGVYGKRYTEESLQLLALLIDAQDKKLVTPKTAAAWLANTRREDGAGQDLVSLPNTPQQAVSRTPEISLPLLAEALTLAVQRGLPSVPPDDELLSMAAARRRYGVPVSVLRGMRVKVGENGLLLVKRSKVLAYIEGLGK